MSRQWTRVKTVELSIDQYQELITLQWPDEQMEWVKENIDENAVGIDGIEFSVSSEEEPECSIGYYVYE